MHRTRLILPGVLPALAGALLSATTVRAQNDEAETPRRCLVFSGAVDADFATDFGTLDQARHLTGLEADLTTQVLLTP
jgi:hypothetical protein